MQKVTSKAIAKVAAVATGLAFATSVLSLAPMAHAAALSNSQIQSILSLLSSFGADASTIANVQASLTGGTPSTGGSTGGSVSSSCTFTKDLTVGSSGADVTCLQNALKAAGYMSVNSTGYFGPATQAAVIKWQKAAGVSPAAGYFGSKSRAAFGLSGGNGSNSGNNANAGTGTGLKVSVAQSSPSGSVLVQGQAIGDLAEFAFANPTSAPINVTGLTFKRVGVSNDSTLTNVYLYNAGTRITDSAGVSSSQFSYSNPSGIFTVPAGGVYVVAVRSDIAGSTSGQQIGVQLVSVSSSGTLDSSVSLPITSGYQTVSAASLATVDYGATVTPSSTSISPQNDFPIWQNTVSVSTNPVKLSSIKFTNLGSIDSAYVSNLRLYVDGTMVGTAQASMAADRTVTFDLTSNPAMLSTQSHTIKVLANVTGGASRTIIMSVQRSSDAMFVDSQLNQPVTPTNNTSTFTAVSAGTVTVNSVSGTSGVSVSLAPTSPSQNVAVGASNVKWASFSMLSSGEATKVMDLYVYSTTSVHAGGLKNGKVFVNGVQVGSTKDIGETSTNKTDFSLGSSLILPSGQTTTVDIYADAKTSTSTNLSNNETVIVSLATVSNNAQGQSSLNSATVPAANTSGNTITVSSSSLTATKYTGYGNQTVIAGSNNAKLGSFTLATGSTEGVTVNTITLTMSSANAASITNLTLKDDSGNMIGTVITTPSATNSFSVNLDVPVSSTKVLNVYGNVLSGSNAGPVVLTVGTATTGTGDITGISASVSATTLQTITVGSGTLTPSKGAGDPVSNNILAGASSVKVGQFQFAASNSAYTVNNLAILIPANSASAVTTVTVKGTDVNGNVVSQTQALSVSSTQTNATATFTGLGLYVPSNDSSNLDVYVGTPTIASGATSGRSIQVTLDAGQASGGPFSASDTSGSVTTQINSGTDIAAGGTFYVRKSIPTIAVTPVAAGAVPTTGSPLYKFSVTADPAGAIEWTKFVFNISTTTASVSSVYLVDDATGTNLLDNTTSSASTTATTITVDLTKNGTQPQYQQVAAGATKTYDLYGTVTSYGATGSTVTISLAADTATAANAAATSVNSGNNIVWSDRSATAHTISTSDWTNGYLLKNLTSTAVSYSK